MNFKKDLKWLSVVVVTLSILAPVLTRAEILDNWHWRNPVPFSDTMHSVCFAAGKFVAVGEGGVIHTSTDAITWDAGQRPVVSTLNRVAFLNGEFIAVGNSGTILTSPDGLTWTPRVSGTASDLLGVAYGNGEFVCCGVGGQLARSANGVDWTTGNNGSNGSYDLGWITFGNGVFVTAGPSSRYTIPTLTVSVSADGQSWTTTALPSAGLSWPHSVWQVEFGNGMFIAAVQDETGGSLSISDGYFYRSTDGTNWIRGAKIGSLAVMSCQFLVYLNGFFHEMADYTTGPALSLTVDGNTDFLTAALTNSPLARSMTFGNGRYVVISDNGSTWYSMDETNWTAAYSGSRNAVYGVVQGANSNLLAVGPMLVSSGGVNFTGNNAPTNLLYSAASDGTNYVAVGGFGQVYTSTNGVDWVQRTGNSSYGLTAVCHGSNRWVAVGGNGTVISSPNTLAWTLRASGTGNTLNAVTCGNGQYVAVGNSGTVITSPDGTAWDVQFSGTVNNLFGVVFQGGQFVAVGVGGTIVTSPDGTNWTAQSSGTNTTFYTVAYGNGRYLVGGWDGYIGMVPPPFDVFLTSSNGTDWQFISTKIPTATSVHSIDYVNQSFWITGENGLLLQSDAADGIPHVNGFNMPGANGVKLNVTLNPPGRYRVQFCTNLLTDSWHDIYIQTNSITLDTWTHTNAFQWPSGYYRVVSP